MPAHMKLKPPEPPFTLKRSLKLETLEYDSITMRFSLGVLSPTTADVSSNGFAAVVTENLVSSSDIEVFVKAWAGFDPDASNLLPLAQLGV